MNEKFILLTTTDNDPVIIGLSNIASIQTSTSDRASNHTWITLNFARGVDLYPKVIVVKETFEQIQHMLGL